MKVFSLLFSLGLIISSDAYASQKVEFTANKVHALLVFVEAISGTPNRPPHLKKVFDESKYNNDESKKHIEEFKNLDSAFGKSFDFDDLPKERKSSVGVRTLVSIQSAFSKDLKDFRQRILGQMNYGDLNNFIEVLSYFEPIYDTLIWKPNAPALNKSIGEFQKKSKTWKLDEMFEKAVAFYNSSWPKSQVFRISLYPIPKEAELSNGQSFGSFESVGFIIGEKIEGKFGVVFHELCHSVYDAQSADVQKNFSSWFMSSPSPFAPVAYGWINEALATALGNGWAYEKAKGKMDKKEWYHHDKINGLAQAIYPKVLEYLSANKAIDQEFVNFAIKSFEEKFPLALSEFETFFSADLVLLTDGSIGASKELRREFRRYFRIQSLNSGSPIDHEKSKGDIKDNDLATLMFVVTEKNLKQLDGITDVVPDMKSIVKSIRKGEDQIGLFNVGKRKAVVLVLQDSAKAMKAIEWMGTARKLDKAGEFLKLDLK